MVFLKAVSTVSLVLLVLMATCENGYSWAFSTRSAQPHYKSNNQFNGKQDRLTSYQSSRNDDSAEHDKTNWLSLLAASVILLSVPTIHAPAANAANNNEGPEGLPAVTQSELGKSVRKQIVGGAQVVDRLDLKWERFSDSLRDEAKCDPRTNRRMFDNGFRRDGTRIGNPVLGALCTPEPLRELNEATAAVVLDTGMEAAKTTWSVDQTTLIKKQEQVQQLVAPSFNRAMAGSTEGDSQSINRQTFNRDLYIEMRAFGEEFSSNGRQGVLQFQRTWGEKMLAKLAPDANRKDYASPFPKPDDTENQPYDEGALLDALGSVSVALGKLQEGGLIGHWEISIPEDDDWNVVTIAVDDDISIGGQILARERNQPLGGSEVVALVRAAIENQAKVSYKMDTFFIDPSTTRQELYDPTQLLLSLSDLGQ